MHQEYKNWNVSAMQIHCNTRGVLIYNVDGVGLNLLFLVLRTAY